MPYFDRWRSRSVDRARSQFAFAPIAQPLSVNVNDLAPESGALSQQPLLSAAHRGQEVRSAPPGPAPSNPPPPIPSRTNRPAPPSQTSSRSISRMSGPLFSEREEHQDTGFPFDWYRTHEDRVKRVDDIPNGDFYLDSLADKFGIFNLTRGQLTYVIDNCQKYVDNDKRQRDMYRNLIKEEVDGVRNELTKFQINTADLAKEIALGAQKERILHSTPEDDDLLPPTVFDTFKPSGDGMNSYSQIDKAFKNPSNKLFVGDKDYPVEVYLKRMTAIQNKVGLPKDQFLQVMLNTSSGRAHATIQSYINTDKGIPAVYRALGRLFDYRITAQEAKDRLYYYRAHRSKSIYMVIDDILVLATRACKDYPVDGRSQQLDSMAYEALLRALPCASQERVRENYAELSSTIARVPTFEEITMSLDKFAPLFRTDIQNNGVTERCIVSIHKDHVGQTLNPQPKKSFGSGNRYVKTIVTETDRRVNNSAAATRRESKNSKHPKAKYIIKRPRESRQVLAIEHEEPTPAPPVRALSRVRNPTPATRRTVNEVSVSTQPRESRDAPRQHNDGRYNREQSYRRGSIRDSRYQNTGRREGNYNPRYRPGQNDSYRSDNNKSQCTVCGGKGHLAIDCRAAFTDLGAKYHASSNSVPCKTCKKVFGKELLHAPQVCPWRAKAQELYERGTVQPIGMYRAKFEENRQ